MYDGAPHGSCVGLILFLVPALVAGPVVATRGLAGLIPGGGAQKSDCYAELEVTGIDNPSAIVKKNRIVLCTEGDPCDVGPCGDNRCDVQVALCINQTDPNLPACIPPSTLQRVKVRSKGKVKLEVPIPSLLTGPQCAEPLQTSIPVKVDRKGRPTGAGKAKAHIAARAPKGTKPRTDGDQITVRCAPRTVPCPLPECGNGTVEAGEQCDPPCSEGQCSAAQLCNSHCQCETAQACTCGSPEPTALRFVTEPGSGTCGIVTDLKCRGGMGACNVLPYGDKCNCQQDSDCQSGLCQVPTLKCTGTPGNCSTQPHPGNCICWQDSECASGFCSVPYTLLDLRCGGLYFGGGAESVPLPAPLPDMGVSVTRACCSGDTLTLSETAPADTGSERTCTTKDCLFGAPLPIQNLNNRPLSTCILNVIARGAVGTADCQTGATTIDLPLRSDIYLFGDLLNGSTPEQPDVNGLQPCPICSKTCSGGDRNGQPCTAAGDCPSGGTCLGSPVCLGGVNHGMDCTPATSILGECDRCPRPPGPGECRDGDQCRSDADCPGEQAPGLPAFCNIPYPTSHDCPPPVEEGQPIGRLPIAFALTTGTASATAADLNGAPSDGYSDYVFCGFCRDDDGTFDFGTCQPDSRNAGTPCAQNSECYVCVGGTQDGQICGGRPEDLESCLNGGGTCDHGTCGGAIPCRSNADCRQPLEACQQRNNGAFAKAVARTITLTGTPSGSLVDRTQHPATLVGTFCIPPIFDTSIDNAADTPGPGATAIPGKAQLLP